MTATKETATLQVFRYDPDASGGAGAAPHFDTYEVPYHKDWVVLDALNHIKDHVDPTLSYRWSCRMGVCGSCGMKVNGSPKLTCAAFLRDYHPHPIRVEPLDNFGVVRDLVFDLTPFLDKLQKVKPFLLRREETPPEQGEYLQTPAEHARYHAYSMCINCMLCYSACPQLQHAPEFIGPAALALGHRYNLDSRDQGQEERKEAMFSHEGIWECTFVGACSEVCPKHVDPAGAIQQAKVQHTKEFFFPFIFPKSSR
jgi:fumarate reductase iron-sulfur subunit